MKRAISTLYWRNSCDRDVLVKSHLEQVRYESYLREITIEYLVFAEWSKPLIIYLVFINVVLLNDGR